MLVIVMVNLKGGSGKTTSAAWILHALHESGLSVLGVDADPENESLIGWSQLAEWDVPVIAMPVANLHRQLPGVIAPSIDVVVIDTPPMTDSRRIVKSAAKLATHIVCPMAPTGMEYDRLGAVRELVTEISDDADVPPDFAVLFNRVIANAASTGVYREIIQTDGVRVLNPPIPRKEVYAQSYPQPIERASTSAYGDAVNDLLTPAVDESEATA
ncbi:ParA family protein [Nocardia flavorosea]|uniref:ParA family protein n=1 Tax=Nocardia flavorosea TaxID=53429 RepID=A0A846YTX1_9NOCA|nr:ParA family protein [Nocardia flavorosea]